MITVGGKLWNVEHKCSLFRLDVGLPVLEKMPQKSPRLGSQCELTWICGSDEDASAVIHAYQMHLHKKPMLALYVKPGENVTYRRALLKDSKRRIHVATEAQTHVPYLKMEHMREALNESKERRGLIVLEAFMDVEFGDGYADMDNLERDILDIVSGLKNHVVFPYTTAMSLRMKASYPRIDPIATSPPLWIPKTHYGSVCDRAGATIDRFLCDHVYQSDPVVDLFMRLAKDHQHLHFLPVDTCGDNQQRVLLRRLFFSNTGIHDKIARSVVIKFCTVHLDPLSISARTGDVRLNSTMNSRQQLQVTFKTGKVAVYGCVVHKKTSASLPLHMEVIIDGSRTCIQWSENSRIPPSLSGKVDALAELACGIRSCENSFVNCSTKSTTKSIKRTELNFFRNTHIIPLQITIARCSLNCLMRKVHAPCGFYDVQEHLIHWATSLIDKVDLGNSSTILPPSLKRFKTLRN